MIGGPAEACLCSRARVDGYRAALETAGVGRRPRSSCAGATSTSRPATSRGTRSSSGPEPPTAIFAGSDLQAFGVYEAARVLGLQRARPT